MTHYLAFKRQDDFVDYLKAMSQIPPLEPRTPEDHLAEFRKAFGSDLVKIDKTIDSYLKKLATQKRYDPMPFYAATYEQSLPAGLIKRAAGQPVAPDDPAMGRGNQQPHGRPPTWQALRTAPATRPFCCRAMDEGTLTARADDLAKPGSPRYHKTDVRVADRSPERLPPTLGT